MRLFRIANNQLEALSERSYRDQEIHSFGEATLEKFLTEHPEIIPSEDIDPDDPPRFMVVKNQASVTMGAMDILLLDHRAMLTVLEVKLIDNREIRREVLAQGIEYLAHLQLEWNSDRLFEEMETFWNTKGSSYEAEAQSRLRISFDREFTERIQSNLDSGKIRLIIAADKLPSELKTVITFLNKATTFDVFGLEVRLFANNDNPGYILAPHLIGTPVPISKGTRWDRERFFAALGSNVSKKETTLAEKLIEFGNEVTGRPGEWGTGKERGSFTSRLAVDSERFSLFSVYTTGNASINIGWNRRFDRLGLDMAQKYRAKVRDELSIEFDQKTWVRGWPMIKLSKLAKDDAEIFKKLITDFISEVRTLLTE